MTCKARKPGGAFALLTLFLGLSTPICAAAENGFAAIAGSFEKPIDVDTGAFSSSRMSIEVVLAPRNGSQLDGLLTDLYEDSDPRRKHAVTSAGHPARWGQHRQEAGTTNRETC
jgi:hypothetical protein